MAEMKSYRIHLSNGRDVRVEARGFELTKQGHLRFYNYMKDTIYKETVYVIAGSLWAIIDVESAEGE